MSGWSTCYKNLGLGCISFPKVNVHGNVGINSAWLFLFSHMHTFFSLSQKFFWRPTSHFLTCRLIHWHFYLNSSTVDGCCSLKHYTPLKCNVPKQGIIIHFYLKSKSQHLQVALFACSIWYSVHYCHKVTAR